MKEKQQRACLWGSLFAGCVLVACAPVCAQAEIGFEHILTVTGEHGGDRFGYPVRAAGDLNHDGVEDWVVQAIEADYNGDSTGSVYLIDGLTGAILHRFDGKMESEHHGFEERGLDAGWDVDLDGTPDILACAVDDDCAGGWNAGAVYVFSGQTYELLFYLEGDAPHQHFGQAVAFVGDVNGDDHPDIAVGAGLGSSWCPIYEGRLLVFSGLDGTELMRRTGELGGCDGSNLGAWIDDAGDFNFDGTPDIIVSSPGTTVDGDAHAGSVFILSGLDLCTLLRIDGSAPEQRLGNFAAVVLEDIDGDTVHDIVTQGWAGDRAKVIVFAGATGAPIYEILTSQTGDLVCAISAMGDVDGDAAEDFIYGVPRSDPSSGGYIALVSGATGSELSRIEETEGIELSFGSSLDGPQNLVDGSAQFIVAAPNAQVGGSARTGVIHVYAVVRLNEPPTCTADLTQAELNFHQPSPGSFVMTEGETIIVPFTGEDPDGDELTATLLGLPASATLTPSVGLSPLTATLEWTPTAADKAGAPYDIEVVFEDPSGETCSCGFTIEDINQLPVCEADLSLAEADFLQPSPGSFVVTEGETIIVPFTGDDADGDDLLAALSGVPADATLSQSAGAAPLLTEFAWTPTEADKAGAPYTVTVTFEDPLGEATICGFTIEDINLHPSCDAGSDVEAEADSPDGKEIMLCGDATDPDDDDPGLMYHWDVPDVDLDDPDTACPTGTFPIGVTQAVLTVTDGRGGVCVDTVQIFVADTTPPEVMCTTDVAALWPPKHDMRDIAITVTATDECDDPDYIFALDITVQSDEADDATGAGDGSTVGDVDGQDGHSAPVDIYGRLIWDAEQKAYVGTIQLRAERDGNGNGRTYTINVTAIDSHGNPAYTSCCVVVPHDRRGGG